MQTISMVMAEAYKIVKLRPRNRRRYIVEVIDGHANAIQGQLQKFAVNLDTIIRLSRDSKQISIIVSEYDMDRCWILFQLIDDKGGA